MKDKRSDIAPDRPVSVAWGDRGDEVDRGFRPRGPRLPGWTGWAASIGIAAALSLFLVGWAVGRMRPREVPIRSFLPGGFEYHEGLLLAVPGDILEEEARVLVDVIEQTCGEARIFALVADPPTRTRMESRLAERGVPSSAVEFLPIPIDSLWVRDYGPLPVKTREGGTRLLDALYKHLEADEQRELDDDVPRQLGSRLGVECRGLPLVVDGGNLLANGAGLLLTTEALLEENEDALGYTEKRVSALLREYLGATRTIYLESLLGEANRHVDMFATFAAADVVVVGQYDARRHPENAAILDRNARRLAGLETPSGPLRVHRIAMPPPIDSGNFPTYTNILPVNGIVLVPTYPTLDETGSQAALELYRRLFPGRRVVGVDATHLSRKGGTLHCATANLLRVAPR